MKVQQWEIDEAINKAIEEGDLQYEQKQHSERQPRRERNRRKTNNSSHSSKSNLQRNASNQTDEN